MKNSIPVFYLFFAFFFLLNSNVFAQHEIIITPNFKDTGIRISPNFSGIAYEISEVSPPENAPYYFGPHNQPLIQMVKTLGIKTIRIGGNTADLTTYKFPDERDIDSLFQFAQKANVLINYTFRLRDGETPATASLAAYIYTHYKANLSCFAIGNEPDLFSDITYETYISQWKVLHNAIVKVAPGVQFCGPNIAGKYPDWMVKFNTDYGKKRELIFLAAHTYPGTSGSAVRNTDSAINQMLSPEWHNRYEQYVEEYVTPTIISGLPFQLEEVNSFYNGGAKHVSDTYTSSLWILDYMYWLAGHHVDGVNFQNGDSVAKGKVLTSCKYAAFVTMPDGYFARPSAYGLKAFDIAGHGQLIATAIENKDSINITAYTVKSSNAMYVTIINKEHFANGRAANILLTKNASFYHAAMMMLTSPDEDVRAESGMLLGNATIKNDGTWNGKWIKIEAADNNKTIKLNIPKATAVIVKMY